ncbi:MAG: serine/threonine-protein kinase [Leifsonia flava]
MTLLDSIDKPSGEPTRQSTSRYEFLEHLGSGGMAEVYRARDRELGRELAIKLFRDGADNPFDELRREREIQLLGALHHPGLVEIYDAGTFNDRGRPRRFIAMEYVAGRSLAARIRAGIPTHRQVADIGAQVADALAYVHSRDIVHRDVKPDNVLVTDDAAYGYTLIAKLADFGIAQFIDGSRFTNHDSVLGTASYISPEQARGEDVGTPSDIYSLGLVLLEAITGEREYRGAPLEAALERLHRSPRVPEGLPEEWVRLLTAMTLDDPAARPTAHDVAATMRDFIRASIIASRTAGSGRRARRSRGAESQAGSFDGTDAAGPRTGSMRFIALVAVANAVIGLVIGLLLGLHVWG